jgi:hypothetical protein
MCLIPPHNFGPPERCYYDVVTEHPGFVVHPFGQGQALYLPWLPGGLFYRQGHTNTTDFCADLLEGVVGLRPVGGNLPPMVEVTVFEKTDGSAQLVHLVNGSGHFGNSFFAPVPMTNLSVVIPCDQSPESVWGLRQDQACPHTWKEPDAQRPGVLTIQVPSLELFEAIQITF